jgi:hypothetical protein
MATKRNQSQAFYYCFYFTLTLLLSHSHSAPQPIRRDPGPLTGTIALFTMSVTASDPMSAPCSTLAPRYHYNI